MADETRLADMHFHVRFRDVDGDREVWVPGDQIYQLIAVRIAEEALAGYAASNAAQKAKEKKKRKPKDKK